MRSIRLVFSICSLVATTLAAGTALATPGFPGALQNDLSLSFEPACSLCHEGGKTGNGTVTTPFGSAMRSRGLVADDDSSLAAALGKMMDESVDSDADGTTDTDELVAGTDPNVAGGGSIAQATPQYGCGATIAVNRPVTGQSATFVAAVVAAAALTLRLRSRRPARERARR